MWYKLGADGLLLLHTLWIVFLVFGLPIGIYFNMSVLRVLHAIGLIFTLALQLTGSFCPLTIWEQQFRVLQDPDFTYQGSVIMTYFDKLVYQDWISLEIINIATIVLLVLAILSFVFRPIKFGD